MSAHRILLTAALASSVLGAADGPLGWLDSEKVRAAYHYGRPPVEDRLQRLADCGINCMILKCTTEKALPWAEQAGKYGIRCFLAFNFNVNAEKAGFRQAVLADGRTEAYACPVDDGFWSAHLTPALLERAKLGARSELSVAGLWIDFELYSTVTGQRYYTNACYCNHCFKDFCAGKGIEAPELASAARAPWIEEHGWREEYRVQLQNRIESLASELREKVHAVAPGFLLGFYPTPSNWSLVGVARGFSTEEVPILLWATDTYGGGGADRIPANWREQYAGQGINARYIAGVLLRRYSARNLAANLYFSSQVCDGYWLFTTFTLNRPQSEHKGDYYLASGTPQEYWDAIARGNREIVRRLEVGPSFQTDLVLGPEPVAYPALVRPELRRRLATLRPPDATPVSADLPDIHLRGPNVVVLAARGGVLQRTVLAFHPVRDGREAISWRVVDPEGNVIAEGAGEEAGDAVVELTPVRDGILFLVASAQSSCWSVSASSVPFALYAGTGLHLMGGPNRLYFQVPAGVNAFDVAAKGGSLHETVRLTVSGPDGTVVATEQSTGKVQDVRATVTRSADDRGIWSVTLGKAAEGIFEDHYVTLPEPLPPVLSVIPEYAFGVAGPVATHNP